jgi:hypothetical protein
MVCTYDPVSGKYQFQEPDQPRIQNSQYVPAALVAREEQARAKAAKDAMDDEAARLRWAQAYPGAITTLSSPAADAAGAAAAAAAASFSMPPVSVTIPSTTEGLEAARAPRANKGGRPAGTVDKKTAHIQQLVRENPALPPRKLRELGDKSILAGMKKNDFSTRVGKARTVLGIPSKPRRTSRRKLQ